jgi:hypothetical protein
VTEDPLSKALSVIVIDNRTPAMLFPQLVAHGGAFGRSKCSNFCPLPADCNGSFD